MKQSTSLSVMPAKAGIQYGKRLQSGMSLVELLISLTISLFFILLVVEFYFYHHKLMHQQQSISRIHENIVAMENIMGTFIRQAGFLGCTTLNPTFPIYGNLASYLKLQSFPHADLALGEKILIQRVVDPIYTSISWIEADKIRIPTSQDLRFRAGDWFWSGNCDSGYLLRVKEEGRSRKAHGRYYYEVSLEKDESIHFPPFYFEKKHWIGKWEPISLYLGKTDRENIKGEPLFALYSQRYNRQSDEEIEGMIHLSFRYQLSGGDHWLTTKEMTQWEKIKTIEVTYTLIGEENSIQHTQIHQWSTPNLIIS